jgi:predicted  nucleic acid-binding Zn-ribbon protein
MKQKNEALAKKKREKEKQLQDVQEKVGKMKSRVSDIKTNKEYQAHLKEIETAEAEIGGVEEEILEAMEELDASSALVRDVEAKVNVELGKLEAFKRELDEEVRQHETEVASLQEQRRQLVASVDPDANALYERLLRLGKGVAVTGAKNEICLGCDMHMPPQLFVEIRKNDDIIQCPQCRRILYYSEDAAEG